jgi:hypothetical protein
MNAVARELELEGYNRTGRIDTDSIQQAIDEIERLQEMVNDADEWDRNERELETV